MNPKQQKRKQPIFNLIIKNLIRMNIQEKQLIFFSTKNVENIKHNFLPMHFEIVVLLSVTVILFPGHLEQPVEPYVSS